MQATGAKFLTPRELEVFQTRRPLGETPSQTGPFRVDLHASPLAYLAESAFMGVGVYEFMSLRRPGDLLRYLWVDIVDLPEDARRRLDEILAQDEARAFESDACASSLPFTKFDSAFWCPERYCWDEEDAPFVHAWVRLMQSPYWCDLSTELWLLTAGIQARLRDTGDELIQHELSLMASRRHRRDWWPRSESIGTLTPPPSDDPAVPPGVFEMFLTLVADPEVRSVSCCWTDLKSWRALALEQHRRATALGIPPREALSLSGPDRGLYDIPFEDWHADVHIPYEGYCDGDVFVVPDWLRFDRTAAEEDDSVRSGLRDKAPRYVISPRPLGTFRREKCYQLGEWAVYIPL